MTEAEAIEFLKGKYPLGLCDEDEYKNAQTAINALEKQIAKRPKYLPLKEGIMTTMYECPNCGCRRLGHGFDIDKCYCPECGQKLKWDSEV